MAFTLTVECSGEEHDVQITDDYEVVVDPEKHDVELEGALIALGAKTPPCMQLGPRWTEEPFQLVGDVRMLVKHQHATPGPYPVERALFYTDGINVHLACDFIEHVANQLPDQRDSSVILIYDTLFNTRQYELMEDIRGPAGARRRDAEHLAERRSYFNAVLRDGDRAQELLDAAEVQTSYDALETPDRTLRTIRLLLLCLTRIACAVRGYHFRGSDLNDVSLLCCRADYQLTGVHTVYGDISSLAERTRLRASPEMSWQLRHMIKALTALIENNPWPSVEA
jgi:hypothetical protein